MNDYHDLTLMDFYILLAKGQSEAEKRVMSAVVQHKADIARQMVDNNPAVWWRRDIMLRSNVMMWEALLDKIDKIP